MLICYFIGHLNIRQRPLGVGESTTSDKICASSGVNSRMNLEVGILTKKAVGELSSSKSHENNCMFNVNTPANTVTICEDDGGE